MTFICPICNRPGVFSMHRCPQKTLNRIDTSHRREPEWDELDNETEEPDEAERLFNGFAQNEIMNRQELNDKGIRLEEYDNWNI